MNDLSTAMPRQFGQSDRDVELFRLVRTGKTARIRAALEGGADPEARERFGATPMLSEAWNQLDGRHDRGADGKHPTHETRFQLRHGSFQFGARHRLPGIRSLAARRGDGFGLIPVHAGGFKFADGGSGVEGVAHARKIGRAVANANPRRGGTFVPCPRRFSRLPRRPFALTLAALRGNGRPSSVRRLFANPAATADANEGDST